MPEAFVSGDEPFNSPRDCFAKEEKSSLEMLAEVASTLIMQVDPR
jgi:hypothetical protein